jgi:hypothetical protein
MPLLTPLLWMIMLIVIYLFAAADGVAVAVGAVRCRYHRQSSTSFLLSWLLHF